MQNFLILTITLIALCLGESFEPSGFDVVQALHSRGFDIDQVEHLSALNGQCSCADACSTLKARYGNEYVLARNETAYTAFRDAYWSVIQTEVYPDCIFLPPDADAVSALLLLSRMTQCPFAFKSGGHSAFAGAASIQGGITVSFQNLNSIELSADRKIAYVEPGNNWLQTYSKLAEDELTVIGGRVARIGVGGLTLGGGISFFSGFHGWACDNVEAYEVVTACGEKITVTPTDYPDLYWALRGGGNNFGIVTSFHLRTVPIPGNNIWAGTRTYLESEFPAVIKASTSVAENANIDPRAGQWAAFVKFNGTKLVSATLWYSEPANIGNTTIFDEYKTIPSVADSTRVRNLVDFVLETQESNPYGLRESYWALTTKASTELAEYAVQTFYADMPAIFETTNVFPVLLFQSISVPQIVNMAQNGGNALGLDPADGPLYMISIPTMWPNATQDESVFSFISGVARKISAKAKEMGLDNDYIYMNYASQFQDVIRGYGPANQARLKEIARKYDPQGVFQTLQPGYFKLNGPPVESNYWSGNWS